jgi:hypothetical protein
VTDFIDADLYIIAVSDDAINTVAAMLPLKPISGTPQGVWV